MLHNATIDACIQKTCLLLTTSCKGWPEQNCAGGMATLTHLHGRQAKHAVMAASCIVPVYTSNDQQNKWCRDATSVCPVAQKVGVADIPYVLT